MAKHVTKAVLREQVEKVEEALREMGRAEAVVDRASAKERKRALEALDKAIKKAEEEMNVYRWMEIFFQERQRELRRNARGRTTKGRHK